MRIVTSMIQKEHTSWKLPERRVNKFVKRYQSQHKNPAGADEDETVATDGNPTKRLSSSLIRMFSPRKSKNAVPAEEPTTPAHQEAAPSTVATASSPVPIPEKEAEDVSEPVVSPEKVVEPDDKDALMEVPSKDIAYETDDNVVSGKEAFHCDVCNIM